MGAAADEAFDEHRTGLDHVSFGLSGSTELEQWRDRLDELGITHGGIKKAHYGSGVSFRDLDTSRWSSSSPRGPDRPAT